MSYTAEKWARKQKAGNARAKAVLIELANCLNDSTGKCYPSIAHISRVTELKPDTVSAATKHLEAIGLIRRTKISTEKGHGIQYELIGYSKTEGSIELSESHYTENGDTPESGITPNLGEHTHENGVAHYPENGDRTYKKEKEITGNTIIRENSSFDDFSLEMSDPEKEEETINVQPSKTLDCPYEEIASIYNEVLGQYLGRCQKLTSTRKKHIKARWNDCIGDKDFDTRQGGLEYFRDYFNYIKKSDFLIGKSGNFRASFDWIFIEGNYTKICEGRYKNRPVTNNYQR